MDRVQRETVQQLHTISPTTNKAIISRDEPSDAELKALPERSTEAFQSWSKTELAERKKIVRKAIDLLLEKQDELAKELAEQMGRPIAYGGVEIKTAAKRADYMLKIAEDSLKDTPGESEQGFTRYIKKVPVGPVLVIFAWNVSSQKNHAIYCHLTCTVSVSNSRKLHHSSTALWQHSHYQAISTNANSRRTYDQDL
jgi:acyl-CoA reductase-like NAD-dependent aldehyde dehydrogenase